MHFLSFILDTQVTRKVIFARPIVSISQVHNTIVCKEWISAA